ncbi:MAG: bifunctional glutamate N-acetyltransferase/amino-acid acetyltransferase ArgJ [Candidatus Eisenbacteria bacterium]|uniref:Arginine biosynthesis bifunctional protein ArgJ n=1 Tax=Eiseniibacteriota bacterium TaxID=2212470 RepID=A0A933SFF0_UNCEI|nr:bifunctional glutamate N-acetyltransferase/amino-acid acetyltransferase ArgJ [Candidatus Eisenbacteria bacterium]
MPDITTEAQLAEFSLAPGFRTAATACGLKKSGALDLLMVWADGPCSAAGVFTTNRVQAAPVLVDRDALASAAGRIRGVVANAGCANAVTGDRGMTDAKRMQAVAASAVHAKPEEMLVLSTGVIGVFLDMDKLERGIAALHSGDAGGAMRRAGDAARAICTTDTRAKVASVTVELSGGRATIAGFAKGAGMIHPNMATMLSVITTDAALAPGALDRALRTAVSESFNRISVDGDMSTNDTVLVLASGQVGCAAADEESFTAALAAVCKSLARQIARDGEGATRLVELRVTGAASERQAHRVGDSIACSPLVKTAVHGNDPNWGRVLAAAGYSGEPIEPARVRLWFGDADDVQLLDRGLPVEFDKARASALLQCDPAVIHLDLGLGDARAIVWTCDFSAEYVHINADYTT